MTTPDYLVKRDGWICDNCLQSEIEVSPHRRSRTDLPDGWIAQTNFIWVACSEKCAEQLRNSGGSRKERKMEPSFVQVSTSPDHTVADILFTELLTELTKLFDREEEQSRSVTAELKHRDIVWVWRGHPGFVGFPEHGDRNLVYRFDRATHRPVLWK